MSVKSRQCELLDQKTSGGYSYNARFTDARKV